MLDRLSNMLKTLGLSSRTKRRVGRERKKERRKREERQERQGGGVQEREEEGEVGRRKEKEIVHSNITQGHLINSHEIEAT